MERRRCNLGFSISQTKKNSERIASRRDICIRESAVQGLRRRELLICSYDDTGFGGNSRFRGSGIGGSRGWPARGWLVRASQEEGVSQSSCPLWLDHGTVLLFVLYRYVDRDFTWFFLQLMYRPGMLSLCGATRKWASLSKLRSFCVAF